MQIEHLGLTHADRLSHIKELNKDDLHVWFKTEREYWEEIFNIIKHSTGDHYYRNIIQKYLTLIEGMLTDSSDLAAIYIFHNEHSLPLHDENPHNEHIKEFSRRGQISTGLYIFNTLLNQQGAFYTIKYKSELLALEEKLKKSFSDEQEKYISSLTETTKSFNTFAETTEKDVTNKLWKTLDNATAEITNTVTAATNAILSAEPVKYWEEREKKHRNKARSYRHAVIGAAISFIATLVFLTLSVYKNGEAYTILDIPITLPAEKFSIALLVICTTAAIWLVRILVKLMMTNLALEIEALERSTMIKTYIAIDSTKAEKAAEIRMLFYTTLFRPSSNSLTDDSTSPEYIRIIEAMLQKKP